MIDRAQQFQLAPAVHHDAAGIGDHSLVGRPPSSFAIGVPRRQVVQGDRQRDPGGQRGGDDRGELSGAVLAALPEQPVRVRQVDDRGAGPPVEAHPAGVCGPDQPVTAGLGDLRPVPDHAVLIGSDHQVQDRRVAGQAHRGTAAGRRADRVARA